MWPNYLNWIFLEFWCLCQLKQNRLYHRFVGRSWIIDRAQNILDNCHDIMSRLLRSGFIVYWSAHPLPLQPESDEYQSWKNTEDFINWCEHRYWYFHNPFVFVCHCSVFFVRNRSVFFVAFLNKTVQDWMFYVHQFYVVSSVGIWLYRRRIYSSQPETSKLDSQYHSPNIRDAWKILSSCNYKVASDERCLSWTRNVSEWLSCNLKWFLTRDVWIGLTNSGSLTILYDSLRLESVALGLDVRVRCGQIHIGHEHSHNSRARFLRFRGLLPSRFHRHKVLALLRKQEQFQVREQFADPAHSWLA